MENELIGYELFVNSKLYPDDYIVSYNHKLYTSEDAAKMALKDLRNHFYITRNVGLHKICYRPVYLTSINCGKYVIYLLKFDKKIIKKRVYSSNGIQDYKLELKNKYPWVKNNFHFNICNIKYGEPIF